MHDEPAARAALEGGDRAPGRQQDRGVRERLRLPGLGRVRRDGDQWSVDLGPWRLADAPKAEREGFDALVHVGGGGFTMPRYLAATRPGTRSVVLELDRASSSMRGQGYTSGTPPPLSDC